jgi:molecular chaperone GrpE (heat shock protein)
MTARAIHLGSLVLPLELMTLRVALYGASGAGKTACARLIAEQVHAAGHRFCAIDLKSDWWGLKSSADGKDAGIPVVVFGGPRKDVQLFEDSGALVADTIAAIEQSAVLDLDAFSKGKQLRFLAAFLERLYDVNRQPIILLCDEADRYASQKPMSPEAIVALGASEDIARRARKRGIGSVWVTQRTAVLNKNVSDLCDLTIVFRTPGARDLDELEDRVGRLATKEQVKEVMKIAPALEDGQAIFLSTHPKLRQYLPATIRPIQLPMPWTFDSSATPGLHARAREPKVLATADLVAIEAKMAATIEKAKADDPRELRKQIADLKKQLGSKLDSTSGKQPLPVGKPVPALTDADRALLDKFTTTLTASVERIRSTEKAQTEAIVKDVESAIRFYLLNVADSGERALADIERRLESKGFQKILGKLTDIAGRREEPTSRALPGVTPPRRAELGSRVRQPPPPRPAATDASVTPARQKILNALAFFHGISVPSVDKTQLALMVGVSPTSGGYFNNLGALRSSGHVEYPSGGTVALTAAGQAIASVDDGPQTTEELHEAIRAKLPPAKWKILETLISVYPASLTKDELAKRIAVSPTSGGYFNNLGSLRSLGLITYPRPAEAAALPVLFLE